MVKLPSWRCEDSANCRPGIHLIDAQRTDMEDWMHQAWQSDAEEPSSREMTDLVVMMDMPYVVRTRCPCSDSH